MILSKQQQLETGRLILKRMNHLDADDLFQMRSHQLCSEFTDSLPDKSIQETRKYIDNMNKGVDLNKWRIWVIEEKTTKKVIGSISIWNLKEEENSGELGFGLHPSFWGQGFMSETLNEIITYGFNKMKLSRIEAYTEENNLRSRKLLETFGFKYEKTVLEEGYLKPQTFKMIVYVLDKNI